MEMVRSQLVRVLISAINEWAEMEAPKTSYGDLRILEDQLLDAIDPYHSLPGFSLPKALAKVVDDWSKDYLPNSNYQHLRELEEELLDQIQAREKEIIRSQELRNAS